MKPKEVASETRFCFNASKRTASSRVPSVVPMAKRAVRWMAHIHTYGICRGRRVPDKPSWNGSADREEHGPWITHGAGQGRLCVVPECCFGEARNKFLSKGSHNHIVSPAKSESTFTPPPGPTPWTLQPEPARGRRQLHLPCRLQWPVHRTPRSRR